MQSLQQKIGQWVEKNVCRYLKNQGLLLITRNFTCRMGEIDLIMSEKECMIFIEVRYRALDLFGDAAETVTKNKQKRIAKTALYYLQQRRLFGKIPTRFDVVSMTKGKKIVWIKNAFEVDYARD